MDTRGLDVFGLPDLQCHFRNLDPKAVAGMLYNTAAYILEHGDVIADGHTVAGISAKDKWQCQHEDSLAAPERTVLDVNPGKPFAAGR
jgi:ligand-binding SRPBCC domain-containing protein